MNWFKKYSSGESIQNILENLEIRRDYYRDVVKNEGAAIKIDNEISKILEGFPDLNKHKFISSVEVLIRGYFSSLKQLPNFKDLETYQKRISILQPPLGEDMKEVSKKLVTIKGQRVYGKEVELEYLFDEIERVASDHGLAGVSREESLSSYPMEKINEAFNDGRNPIEVLLPGILMNMSFNEYIFSSPGQNFYYEAK